MMVKFFCVLSAAFMLALPVSASEVAPDETVAYISEAPQAAGTALSGGYYFVCSCALGDSIKFYVPVEWAFDSFALNEYGAPVNMSTSTCYAYCEAYPEYTFTCSRFGTFNYRVTNSSTTSLDISNISDTNISFLEDETVRLSDSDVLLLIAGMIFVFGAAFILLRR